MNGIALYAGMAIGELGFEHLLPDYRTVAYVEIDKYCRSIIRARIRDGVLQDAPMFDDIRTFNARFASCYAGKVDWVSAGFPCQPFSNAGKQTGGTDERNLWPETIECISILRPRYAFLENVPAIVTNEYFRRIQGDLAEIFYDCIGLPLSAAEVGGCHKRERIWILAYPGHRSGGNVGAIETGNNEPRQRATYSDQVGRSGEQSATMPDTNSDGCNQARPGIAATGRNGIERSGKHVSDSQSAGLERPNPEGGTPARRRAMQQAWSNGRAVEPGLGRVADGVADRVDRLKAIGNGWDGGMVPGILKIKTK